ncbi:CPBP family intramembrane glutamic endopeptidase [Arthrobacter crusticola]|uniref:CPBP family intramembrane glutamic endopeptidase n=1 Tax=Arthrobacter crusticola TaxID=2547960 RepID=UPI001FE329E5|nr:CPBP family intramembrane glutamic endopeptidase [Arthrobacter crusticola]
MTLRQAGWAMLFVGIYAAAFLGAVLTVGLFGVITSVEALVVVCLCGATAVIFLSLYLHLFRRNRLSLGDLGFRRPTRRMFHLLWQIPVSMLAAGALQGLFLAALAPLGVDTSSAGSSDDTLTEAITGVPAAVFVIAFIVIAVLTPLWEEVLFRGAFLSGFLRRFRPSAAILLSAALFAAVHLVLLTFAYLFALGVALALLQRFHRNLWAPVLLHAANNAVVTLVAFSVA